MRTVLTAASRPLLSVYCRKRSDSDGPSLIFPASLGYGAPLYNTTHSCEIAVPGAYLQETFRQNDVADITYALKLPGLVAATV